VVLSVAMAVIFSAPLALMMGVLAPAMVIGGWWEQRRQGRVKHELALAHHHQAQAEWDRQVDDRARNEAKEARRRFPDPAQWLADDLWRGFAPDVSHVRVGLSWVGNHAQTRNPGLVLVDFTSGLALVGGPDALGVWQNLLLQWCAATPGSLLAGQLLATSTDLPTDIRGASRLVWVSALTEVPSECQAVLVVGGEGLGTLSDLGQPPHRVRCDVATVAILVWGCQKLCPPDPHRTRPRDIDLTRRDQLWCHLREGGPLWDLVAWGPHAVVWGATGSGKSVSVVSLVSSIINRYSPHEVVLVVIDFKGGAGLKPLARAPHTIGWVTDLDPGKSSRVMQGLRTEMVKREKILAAHDVADVAGLDATVSLPRLLLVVDEVAWLLTNNPPWGDALADVLARGRSLGIHVILSTQRVSGVLTRAMMANVALRVCGGVRDQQELVEWMPGVPADLALRATGIKPGEVCISGGVGAPALVEVGVIEPAPRFTKPSPWRVWVDELPAVHPWSSASFGLVECVETQTHRNADYTPGDGSIVVVGDVGSGRTQATRAIGGLCDKTFQATATPADTWLALRGLSGQNATLIIDDADTLVSLAGVEGEAFLLDALESFQGTLIMSLRADHRVSRHLARLAPHAVVLSVAKSEQAALWGGNAFSVPGRGLWRGDVVQVGYGAPDPALWSEPPYPIDTASTIIVTEDPRRWQGYQVHSVVAPESFSTAFMGHGLGVAHPTVVWDGISHRDVRFATAGKAWIPPLEPPAGAHWVSAGGSCGVVRPADWLR